MPTDTTSRGVSALSAFGLFLTAIVLAYLNTTTSAFFWSTIYMGGIGICTLAFAAKIATALGVENKFAEVSDSVAGIVPWVALYFDGTTVLHYTQPGLPGFMAGIALIALILIGTFGVMDSLYAWFGDKYAKGAAALSAALDALDEPRRA